MCDLAEQATTNINLGISGINEAIQQLEGVEDYVYSLMESTITAASVAQSGVLMAVEASEYAVSACSLAVEAQISAQLAMEYAEGAFERASIAASNAVVAFQSANVAKSQAEQAVVQANLAYEGALSAQTSAEIAQSAAEAAALVAAESAVDDVMITIDAKISAEVASQIAQYDVGQMSIMMSQVMEQVGPWPSESSAKNITQGLFGGTKSFLGTADEYSTAEARIKALDSSYSLLNEGDIWMCVTESV